MCIDLIRLVFYVLKTVIMDRLKVADTVKVSVYDADGRLMGTFEGTGLSDLRQAIEAAYASVKPTGAADDYTYVVADLTTGTEQKYFLDAGGRVRKQE